MLTSGVYFCVLIFLATKAVQVQTFCYPSKSYCTPPDSCFADDINFIYYDCDGNNKTFPINKPQALMTVLNTKKRTILYIFGFSQTPETDIVQDFIKALCCNKDDNIVLLDWSKYSVGPLTSYPDIALNAEKLGKFLARIINLLKKAGLNIKLLYIIGVSLGAHMAGIAGKCTKILKIGFLPRITGLDPANPAYENKTICHLEKYDATCVDVIHTDMGGYGTPNKCGTADYYSNRGIRYQPGCNETATPYSDEDFCSHRFAVKVYAVTKCQPCKFNATQCCSYDSYKAGNCSGNLNTTVGYAACCDVRGDFYFTTTKL